MFNTVPRMVVRQVVLGAAGILASGTITPNTPAGAPIPNKIVAANVYNAAAWTYSDNATVAMPVAAGVTEQLPGSFVRNAIFAAGTYIVAFFLDD